MAALGRRFEQSEVGDKMTETNAGGRQAGDAGAGERNARAVPATTTANRSTAERRTDRCERTYIHTYITY